MTEVWEAEGGLQEGQWDPHEHLSLSMGGPWAFLHGRKAAASVNQHAEETFLSSLYVFIHISCPLAFFLAPFSETTKKIKYSQYVCLDRSSFLMAP